MPAPVVALTAIRAAKAAARDKRLRLAVAAVAAAGFMGVLLVVAPFLTFISMTPPPPDQEAAAGRATVPPANGGPVAGIPAVSYAALVLASQGSEQAAGCFVSVPVLGGVMGIESGYGTFGGSAPDPVTGVVTPPIFGPALAPGSGFEVIPNDDYGRSLGVVGPWARAVGPTQFLPSTWRSLGRDGNGDGVADPQNIYDAALSTAAYLCAHGYLEGNAVATRGAIFRYNPSNAYVQAVLARAAELSAALAVAAPEAGPQPGLSTVRGITVASSIAVQLEAMLAAAEADGIRLGGWGWRSYQDQVDLRRAHCGSSEFALYVMDPGSCSPPTARPGTSNHEDGLAVDFHVDGATLRHGTRAFDWLAANAARYGFHNLPSESWHWSVDGR